MTTRPPARAQRPVDGEYRAVAGRWRSVYDGVVLRSASAVDIDHVVPPANAWRSGARSWSRARRERFANDRGDPELIAVSAAANRAKGDSGPQSWRPPRRAVWCLYARWWIDVKHVRRLSITRGEKRALGTMLRTCG